MRKKKIKYRKIVFKLSDKQFKVVKKYCEARAISPNKLFKQSIKDFILKNNLKGDNECYISENQLDLFDLVEEIEREQEYNAFEDAEDEDGD